MASHYLQQGLEDMDSRIADLERKVQQQASEAAYMYIHSNWTLIRWYLVREQDRAGEGSEVYKRAKNAETIIRDYLPRNLRAVQFDPKPMEVALKWRIEATLTLTQNGYTFFD